MIHLSRRKAPSAQVLLVHREPRESRIFAQHLRHKAGAAVESTQTATEGSRLIVRRRFDLALIEAVMPDMSGVHLAILVANQNTPVLLLSENALSSAYVRGLGYPYLEKPFDLDVLVSESMAILGKARRAVRNVAASADRVEDSMSALTAEVAEAHRLFDLIVERLGRKWLS